MPETAPTEVWGWSKFYVDREPVVYPGLPKRLVEHYRIRLAAHGRWLTSLDNQRIDFCVAGEQNRMQIPDRGFIYAIHLSTDMHCTTEGQGAHMYTNSMLLMSNTEIPLTNIQVQYHLSAINNVFIGGVKDERWSGLHIPVNDDDWIELIMCGSAQDRENNAIDLYCYAEVFIIKED
ncbi:hypothetical protein ES705_43693 [subsurface metagenome]